MRENQIKGKRAEAEAVRFLVTNQFRVLEINWRHSRYEIDIIAACKGILHFVEVKGRWGEGFGAPELAVDQKKLKHMQMAAKAYCAKHPYWKQIQYDVIAVEYFNGKVEIRWVEDVYYF
jgi:putative endonuclease